jgi:PAS domain-containing protein
MYPRRRDRFSHSDGGSARCSFVTAPACAAAVTAFITRGTIGTSAITVTHDTTAVMKRDDSVILLECMVSSIAWGGSQATLVTVVDMTERKRAEQGLRTSEERFRQIAENIKEAFLVVELDGYRPLYLSRMWEEIWGRPLEEA